MLSIPGLRPDKINILYNQTGKTNLIQKAKPTGRTEINELPPGARFRIESIASEKRISSLVVADLNGDGKLDEYENKLRIADQERIRKSQKKSKESEELAKPMISYLGK